MANLAIVIIASYLLGSFPTGIIAGRLLKGIDIRKSGSGNTGATNSFRVLGWKAGIAVALIDMAKGAAAVLWAGTLAPLPGGVPADSVLFIAAALAAVLGHILPVFAGFKGGKGFGTAAGAISAAYPVLAPLCLAVFFITLGFSGYVALCASVTAAALPLLYLLSVRFFGLAWDPAILGFFIFAALFTAYSVRRKLALYFSGKAELFRRAMIFRSASARRGGE